MSIKVMTFVWEAFPGSGGELIVLLAMADYADDEGGNIYPSVPTLAKKSRMSDRGVQKVLRGLQDVGWIELVAEAENEKSRAREYRIPWRQLRKTRIVDPSGRLVPPVNGVHPEQGAPGEPEDTPPVNPGSPNTPSNHQSLSKRRKLNSLPDDFALSDRVTKWCAERRLPTQYVGEQLEAFKSNARAKDMRYADWDEAFMTWMRRQPQFDKTAPRTGKPPAASTADKRCVWPRPDVLERCTVTADQDPEGQFIGRNFYCCAHTRMYLDRAAA